MKFVLFLLLSLVLIKANIFSSSSDGKCRALAMRGGGTKGAYEVGALKALISLIDPQEYRYDAVVGVSIGALNSAIMGLHAPGQEKEAVDELEKIWRTYQVQDLWRHWPKQGIVAGLWKDGFLDNSPLREIVKQTFEGREYKRMVSFEAVDMNTGKIITFDHTVPDEHRLDAVLASASIPGIFPQVRIDDLVLGDGGTFDNLGLAQAVNMCRSKGFKDSDIIIDMLLCYDGPIELKKWTYEEAKYKTAKQLNRRKSELKAAYYYKDDVDRVMEGLPDVQFRYMVTPSINLPASFIPIFSTQEEILFQLELGERDMTRTILQSKHSNIDVLNNKLDHRRQLQLNITNSV